MSLPTTSGPICSRCGSPLIFVSKTVDAESGSKFPTTTTVYRCSNETCQDEKEKGEAKRIKLKEEQEVAKKKREEERRENTRLSK